VTEVQNWAPRQGQHMHYFEPQPSNVGGHMISRTENYLNFHPGLAELFGNASTLASVAAELLEDDQGAVVFKERINYKLPGGGGFAAHQDAPAWSGTDPTGADAELSFMKHSLNMNVAVDRMYLENGGLEVVRGFSEKELVPQKEDGSITDEFVASQIWEPVVLEPGDVLFFSLHIPHRSGPNRTTGSRRAVYITYAGRSSATEQDKIKYYEDYRKLLPPAGEQQQGSDYSRGHALYNWATPFSENQPSMQSDHAN